MVGLKKTVTYAKISPKSGEPQRSSWGTQKKKKKKKKREKMEARGTERSRADLAGVNISGLKITSRDASLTFVVRWRTEPLPAAKQHQTGKRELEEGGTVGGIEEGVEGRGEGWEGGRADAVDAEAPS